MKYCNDYAASLDLFVDGELTPAEMADVQAHLDTCPGCRAYVDDALAMRAAFPDVEDTVVPEGFAASVMEAVAASTPAKKPVRKNHWLKVAMPLAACLAVVIVLQNGPVTDRGGWGMGSAKTSAAPAAAETAEEAPAAAAPMEMMKAKPAEEEEEEAKVVAEEAKIFADEPAAQEPAAETPKYTMSTTQDGTAAETGALEDVILESNKITEREDAAGPSRLFPARLRIPAEAARFLEGFTPMVETEAEWHYHLNRDEFSTLQGQLKHAGITPLMEENLDADTDVILVLLQK